MRGFGRPFHHWLTPPASRHGVGEAVAKRRNCPSRRRQPIAWWCGTTASIENLGGLVFGKSKDIVDDMLRPRPDNGREFAALLHRIASKQRPLMPITALSRPLSSPQLAAFAVRVPLTAIAARRRVVVARPSSARRVAKFSARRPDKGTTRPAPCHGLGDGASSSSSPRAIRAPASSFEDADRASLTALDRDHWRRRRHQRSSSADGSACALGPLVSCGARALLDSLGIRGSLPRHVAVCRLVAA